MNAYAAAINTRTAEMRENLGSLEIAWRSVKNTASEAWDSMLNIGREVPISDKLEETRRQLENAKRDLVNLKKGSVNVDTTGYGFGRKSDSLGSQESTQAIIEKQSLVLRLQKQLGELGEKSYQESIKAGKRQPRADQEAKNDRLKRPKSLVVNMKMRPSGITEPWQKFATLVLRKMLSTALSMLKMNAMQNLSHGVTKVPRKGKAWQIAIASALLKPEKHCSWNRLERKP
ncbi:hypothetical protein AABD61_06090 [Edwardsiella piscicida]|uniref:hypothetical protein n=1 Tax=Edwardsiella piscicida TaxID=1263550 RepID=UPI00370DCD98